MDSSYLEQDLDNIFEALSNQKRRGMLHDLSFQPLTVSRLAQSYSLSLPAIHKHIKTLEKAKLIDKKKSGRVNFVALNNTTMSLAQSWVNQYKTGWGSGQATLENYVARMNE